MQIKTGNRQKGSGFIGQYILTIGVIVVLTNLVMGLVLMHQSTAILRDLVRKNMLNVATTAADLLNGDELGSLTADSVGNEAYNRVYNSLSAFRDNADIEFIYAVKEESEGHYVFTVDVDPENPGEFGEEVLVTEALERAADGTAAVDDKPAQDEWGNFYSAYCPVFDSAGSVAGIVGIDYNSEWYDRQIREHTVSIGTITLISALFIGFLVLSMIRNVRRRLEELNSELSLLADDVDRLSDEITSSRDYRESLAQGTDEETVDADGDQIAVLSSRIHSMHRNLSSYLSYEQSKARTDGLTGVGNSTAYIELQNSLKEAIQNGNADFAAVVFDIDYLKTVNDTHGHKCGDRIIIGAADAISSVFGREHTFRIGGDEFAVIAEHTDRNTLRRQLEQVQSAVARFNEESTDLESGLSVSFGEAFFDAASDTSFRDVFIRADQAMYERKRASHQKAEAKNSAG